MATATSRGWHTVASIVLPIALFCFSVGGFFSIVSGERWALKNDDGSRVTCTVGQIENGASVRRYGASCSNGSYYMTSGLMGDIDLTREITETEFVLRAHIAQRMGAGWKPDVSMEDPAVIAVLDEMKNESADSTD